MLSKICFGVYCILQNYLHGVIDYPIRFIEILSWWHYILMIWIIGTFFLFYVKNWYSLPLRNITITVTLSLEPASKAALTSSWLTYSAAPS